METTSHPILNNRPITRGGALRACIVALFLAPWTVFWGVCSMFLGILGCRRLCTRGIEIWAHGILFVAGIRIKVRHNAPLDPAIRYLFLSNHQSALDIPILFHACPIIQDVRFMAKESLFKIPFLGWGMSLTGFVPIRRENARHSATLIQDMARATPQFSYIIFPEGTRSSNGRLQPLKRGAIGLVMRLNQPIVPVTIVDACRANPKGTARVRSGTVQVIFHEPITIAVGATKENTRDELLETIYNTIASALPEDQKPSFST
ncbi:MAG: lysophospholipid acyltransferase family protein [Planctomycetota bacterium]